MNLNHLTPKATTRPAAAKGAGSYAVAAIDAGEVVAVFGGHAVARVVLDSLPDDRRRRSIQVEDDIFLVSGEVAEPGDIINHSCEPSCQLSGNIVVVARRPIDPGEELTIDYATCDGSDYDEFDCHCGTSSCRGRVTGNDWMRPELQVAYRGAFSPYLERRITGQNRPDRRMGPDA